MDKYLQSCKTVFWRKVFTAELDYIVSKLKNEKEILSVGCGPAIIETDLTDYGYNVTGLDISPTAIGQAPESFRAVCGTAEKMNFADSRFDAVIYVASLQFIEKYEDAIQETARVLTDSGRLLVMLLNPRSVYFQEKMKDPASYVNRIIHTNTNEIEKTVSVYFHVKSEYFLGISGFDIYPSSAPEKASLYILNGIKR